MNTISLSDNQNQAAIKAASIIRSGGVVILPFDTVYGFACDPRNDNALEKIFMLKKRHTSKTIGLAASNIEKLIGIAELSDEQKALISNKMPGKFTFILKAKSDTGLSNYCIRNGTIGVRIPDSDFILNLISSAGGIIAQTSANISGMQDCYSIDELKSQYGDTLAEADLIVDGGAIKKEGASEIWDLTGKEPKIIERTS